MKFNITLPPTTQQYEKQLKDTIMKNAELKQKLDKLLADNWVIHEQLLFQEKVIAWYEARTNERAPIHELCEEEL